MLKQQSFAPFRRATQTLTEFVAHTLLFVGVHLCLLFGRRFGEWASGGHPLVFFGRVPLSWFFDVGDVAAVAIIVCVAVYRIALIWRPAV